MTFPPCPICEAATPAIFHRQGGVTLLRCGGCGFVWLDPLPGRPEVAALYDDAYAQASTGYFAKAEKKLARARRRVRQILKLLPGGAAGRSFLDVGCNGGFTAEAAREAGFTAFGVEPDPVSVAYARKHYPQATYVTGLLEDGANGRDRLFDVNHLPLAQAAAGDLAHAEDLDGAFGVATNRGGDLRGADIESEDSLLVVCHPGRSLCAASYAGVSIACRALPSKGVSALPRL